MSYAAIGPGRFSPDPAGLFLDFRCGWAVKGAAPYPDAPRFDRSGQSLQQALQHRRQPLQRIRDGRAGETRFRTVGAVEDSPAVEPEPGVGLNGSDLFEAAGNARVAREVIGDLHGGREEAVARRAVRVVVILDGADDLVRELVAGQIVRTDATVIPTDELALEPAAAAALEESILQLESALDVRDALAPLSAKG